MSPISSTIFGINFSYYFCKYAPINYNSSWILDSPLLNFISLWPVFLAHNYFKITTQNLWLKNCEMFTPIHERRKTIALRWVNSFRSSHPEVFSDKGVLKIWSKFTGENPCRIVISIRLLCSFVEITLRHGYSPANLLHIFITPFTKSTSGFCSFLVIFQ